MATNLSIYVVRGKPGADSSYYCPTCLDCAYASDGLIEALDALGTVPGLTGSLVYYGACDDESSVSFPMAPRPRSSANSLQFVTAAQLLTVPWDALSTDPYGKRVKGAAWAYVHTLEPDALLIVKMDS